MDVLEPGKVITPDNDLQGGSHRDNGARPKSRDQKGKKSKGEQIPNKNKDERPGQTLDSKSIQGGKKGAGKGARKDMGKLDLKDGQDSPRDCDGGKHTPNRRMKGEVGFQRDVWNGSSGQKNTHREGNGKGLRKQGKFGKVFGNKVMRKVVENKIMGKILEVAAMGSPKK